MNTETNATPSTEQLTLAEVDQLWKTKSDKWKEAVANNIIKQFPVLQPFPEVIIHAFTVLGANPQKSHFLHALIDIGKGTKNWSPKMISNVNTLVTLVQQGKVKITKERWKSPLTLFLYPPSTYDRPPKDFVYTVTIAEIMSDPAKQRHYFKDLPKDAVDNFFTANNEVKPAGNSSDPYNTDTIYGVVEMLAGENHENVKKDDKRLKDNRNNEISNRQ